MIKPNINESDVSLKVDHLPDGIYLLESKQQDKTIIKKLIIQR